MMMEKLKINKNATPRRSQEQRTDARDSTHEQRKPKKKRKRIKEDNAQSLFTKTELDSVPYLLEQEQQTTQTKSDCLCEKVKSDEAGKVHIRKTMPPRMKSKTCQAIPPAPQKKTHMPLICYPIIGANYSNPELPLDDISFPTQVSEQQGSNIDEVVFSNGRSIKVEHAVQNQIQSASHALNAEASCTGFSRQLNQQHRYLRNAGRNNNVEQKVPRRPRVPPRYPEYRDYDQRLKSYARWWKQEPDSVSLCNAGFFFTNQEDLVRCYQCGIGLKDLSSGDKPLNEHVKHSVGCLYLQEYLGDDGLANIKKLVQSEDMCQNREEKLNKYRHPEYQSYQVRLSSFSHWPPSMRQKPEQLAEAGLYFTGFEDNVRCFACDGGLKHWDPEDDPWIEHCRWFPDCPFVRTQKGDSYIGLVQGATAMEQQERFGKEEKPINDSAGNEITGEMERLTLKDPELNTVINEHRELCLEMGYSEKDFNIAANKLAKKGNVRPTIEDVLDAIEAAEEKQNKIHKQESPIEENIRLKSMLYCMSCGVNSVNALFLPCTHHRMCMTCAQQLTQCPVCERQIREKIKTYLV